ncbi:MAG: hypothetical protein PHQ80_03835 [Candidatus ainarchaeum sp.]|nr:hypothetical protein [Candidatus ainarchaeum sp.]
MQSKYAWAFGCFVFMVATVVLFNMNQGLESQLSSTQSELGQTKVDLQMANRQVDWLEGELQETRINLLITREELSETKNMLNFTQHELARTMATLDLTQGELEATQSELESTVAEFEQLGEEISELSESIDSSIQWFKGNAALPVSMNRIYVDVRSSCESGGVLNLGCAVFIMEREIPFEYRDEMPDRLYSISEMARKRGGDCEDYSLLLKALINTFRQTGRDMEVQAWESKPGTYVIYDDGSTMWYVAGEGKSLGNIQDLTPYVICFVTGFQGSQFQGHCVVAVGDEVGGAEGLRALDGAKTFEPQTGQYLGSIGSQYNLCGDGDEFCGTDIGDIVLIIADDDLYQFSEGGWKSYESYGRTTDELQRTIREFTR